MQIGSLKFVKYMPTSLLVSEVEPGFVTYLKTGWCLACRPAPTNQPHNEACGLSITTNYYKPTTIVHGLKVLDLKVLDLKTTYSSCWFVVVFSPQANCEADMLAHDFGSGWHAPNDLRGSLEAKPCPPPLARRGSNRHAPLSPIHQVCLPRPACMQWLCAARMWWHNIKIGSNRHGDCAGSHHDEGSAPCIANCTQAESLAEASLPVTGHVNQLAMPNSR